MSRSLQFFPGHVHGRIASAQPVRRRGGDLRPIPQGGVGSPAEEGPGTGGALPYDTDYVWYYTDPWDLASDPNNGVGYTKGIAFVNDTYFGALGGASLVATVNDGTDDWSLYEIPDASVAAFNINFTADEPGSGQGVWVAYNDADVADFATATSSGTVSSLAIPEPSDMGFALWSFCTIGEDPGVGETITTSEVSILPGSRSSWGYSIDQIPGDPGFLLGQMRYYTPDWVSQDFVTSTADSHDNWAAITVSLDGYTYP